MLKFDEATRRIIESAYLGADVVRRRMASLSALDLRAGERVLDLGCGTGLMTAEIARGVGPEGRAIGVDPSPDMRAAAAAQCAGMANVTLLEGDAAALPVEDGAVDKAASLQVFEYVPDIPAALDELRRALRPGGRVVIGNNHWGSLVWESDDEGLMGRMLAAWDSHVAERAAPARLPGLLRAAGFDYLGARPVHFFDETLRPDGLANMILHLASAYAVDNGLVAPGAAANWRAEQAARAREGRFFFSLTHFVSVAVRR